LTYTRHDYFDGSPVIAEDGTIYVDSYLHQLYAITPDGGKKWAVNNTSPALPGLMLSGTGGLRTAGRGSWFPADSQTRMALRKRRCWQPPLSGGTMKSTSSPLQIGLGVALGIVLQPLSMAMAGALIIATTRPGTEERGWGSRGASLLYFTYFGMAQVLTILPAALLLLPIGKHGVVPGLLFVWTFLALANIAVLVFLYATKRTIF
jgi:hypothetical protein